MRKLLVFSLLFLPACSGCPGFGNMPDNAVPVVVQTVAERQSSPHVTVYGVIHPGNRADIQFPSQVKIDKVFVNVGDTVVAGATLLKLSDDEITVRLNQLRASKTETEAIIEKNSFLLKNRDKLLEEAKIDKTQYTGLESEVTANNATLERIKTDIAAAEHDLANQTIGSPIAGQVTDRKASPGLIYAANDILMTIASTDPVIMVFPVSVDDAPGIAVGTPVMIKLEDVSTAPISTTVSYIGPTLDPSSKTFDAWATLPNPDGMLKINMRGTVEFTSSVTHKVFAVPPASISMREHDATLFTVKGGVARQTVVTVREMTPTEAIIGSGLQAGDLIVVKGWEKLQDGSPVDLRH